MAFGKQIRQDVAQGRLLVEEANPADAQRMITAIGQTGDDIGSIEQARFRPCGFAAGKTHGEEPRMEARCRGRWEEPGKERMMGRIGEIAGRMPFFPSCGRKPSRQIRRYALLERLFCHVVTECIECDQQQVTTADQPIGIEHGDLAIQTPTHSDRSRHRKYLVPCGR